MCCAITYVLRNNQLFYFTFSFAIIVVICVCTIFLLLDKKQEQYINSLLEYQHQLKITGEGPCAPISPRACFFLT